MWPAILTSACWFWLSRISDTDISNIIVINYIFTIRNGQFGLSVIQFWLRGIKVKDTTNDIYWISCTNLWGVSIRYFPCQQIIEWLGFTFKLQAKTYEKGVFRNHYSLKMKTWMEWNILCQSPTVNFLSFWGKNWGAAPYYSSAVSPHLWLLLELSRFPLLALKEWYFILEVNYMFLFQFSFSVETPQKTWHEHNSG